MSKKHFSRTIKCYPAYCIGGIEAVKRWIDYNEVLGILNIFFIRKKLTKKKKIVMEATNEPPHGKTNNLHRRKQRCRSASR